MSKREGSESEEMMGQGTDAARAAGSTLHPDVLDDFKDQLLICLLKRLCDEFGNFSITVEEIDSTGSSIVNFAVRDRAFHFEVRPKQ